MGDCSVACSLTGITLHGQAAVFIPLVPRGYTDPRDRWPEGAVIVTNEGAGALFAPATLPIFVGVNSYARAEAIEENDHTRYLERRLKMPISEFVSACEEGARVKAFTRWERIEQRGRNEYTWDGRMRGCYIERGAWDRFIRGYRNDYTGAPENTVYTSTWPGPSVLRALGFTAGAKDLPRAQSLFGPGPHQGDRYNVPYTHPAVPGVVLWSDDNMSVRIEINGRPAPLIQKEKGGTVTWGSDPHFIGDIQAALSQRGLTLPKEALKWARTTPTSQPELEEWWAEARELNRQRREEHENLVRDPQKSFKLIGFRKDRGADEQVFCDERYHVHLRGERGDAYKCDCTDRNSPGRWDRIEEGLGVTRLPWPEKIFEDLREKGWKGPRRKWRPLHNSLVRDAFGELLPYVYRSQFWPRLGAELIELIRVMTAANRLLAPSLIGSQYGNPYVLGDLAQYTAAYSIAEIQEKEQHLSRLVNIRRVSKGP